MSNFNFTYQKDGENEQLYYKDSHNNDLYIRSCEDFAPAIIAQKTGDPVAINDAAKCPIRKLKITLEPIQEGTGEPSPDNVRPISGRDSVTAWRTGKNLFDGVWESGSILNQTGENTPDSACIRCKNYIPCKNGQSIYMGWDTTATGSIYMLVMTYGADGSYKRYAGARTNPYTLKLNDDEHFIRFYLFNRTEQLVNPYIVYGSTASSYEPYNGQSVTVQLGQTVYGGTVDAVNGELTVDWAFIESYNGEEIPGEWISDRDTFAPDTTPTIGAQVCYKLSIPDKFNIEPATLSMLKGDNTITTDRTNIELEYVVDTKTYIDNLVNSDAKTVVKTNDDIEIKGV